MNAELSFNWQHSTCLQEQQNALNLIVYCLNISREETNTIEQTRTYQYHSLLILALFLFLAVFID